MAPRVRTDPFSAWRARQHTPDPEKESSQPEPVDIPLSPARQAQALIAWCDYRLAKLRGETGDQQWQVYNTTVDQQLALQAAEHYGTVPDTIEGCQAVLACAAEIITIVAETGHTLP